MEGLSFDARYFRVARHDLVYMKFILEAYEGLAVMSTIQREDAIVRIGYPRSAGEDLDGLINALADEIQLIEIPRPEGFGEGLPELPKR
jgi:hypothetical protein